MSLDEAGIPVEDAPPCPLDTECAPWREWVTKSLAEGKSRFDAQQKSIAENTALTQGVKDSVDATSPQLAELLEILKGAKTGVHAINRLGRCLLWIGRQAPWLLALGGLVYFFKTGHWPKGAE